MQENTRVCFWNIPSTAAQNCINIHEQSHLTDPDPICGEDGYSKFRNTTAQNIGECKAHKLSAACLFNIDLETTHPHYTWVEWQKKGSLDQAITFCTAAGLPTPTPFPELTPVPSP
jgi:hypothetical protein